MLEWHSSYLAVNKTQTQYTWNNMEFVALESSIKIPEGRVITTILYHGTDDQKCWPTKLMTSNVGKVKKCSANKTDDQKCWLLCCREVGKM